MEGKNIKCTNCGASLEIPGGLNKIFCSYCGTQNLITDVLEIPGVTIFCMSCNTNNKYENHYCDKCGAQIQKICRYCKEMHPLDKKFCPKTGLKIEKKKSPFTPPMTLIKGGTFQMGNAKYYQEHTVHHVTINNFHMGTYEITNSDFCNFLNALGNQIEKKISWLQKEENEYSGINFGDTFTVKTDYEKRPLVYVSWYGAIAYCNWLSEEEGLEKCYGEINNRGNCDITKDGYRLPTEAEWEFACRCGTNTAYFWGEDMNDEYCWYGGNSGDNHHETGIKKANPWGLYDMSGNLWEWCNDWHGAYGSKNELNPTGPDSGTYKVVRGGSWKQDEESCRSANRSSIWPGTRSHKLGFRIAKSV